MVQKANRGIFLVRAFYLKCLKLIGLLIIKIIFIYQYVISPYLPASNCRFTVSCSEYTKIVISKYGLITGCYLGFKRILRCQPFLH